MTPDHKSRKLKALPVQLIETDGGVILKRGIVELKLNGERAAEILQSLLLKTIEKGATGEEICAAFAAPDRPSVAYLIEQLVDRRILVASDSTEEPALVPESNLEVFYWNFGERAEEVSRRLNRRHIVIVGVNCISRQLAAALTASEMRSMEVIDYPLLRNLRLFGENGKLNSRAWPSTVKAPLNYKRWIKGLDPESLDCLVATSDFGGQQLMREWNEFCVSHNRHFLPVVLQDMRGYIGPLVVPGETACFECSRLRQNAHMKDALSQRAAEEVAFAGQAVNGFHPSMASILGDLAAIELIKLYDSGLPLWRVGTLITVNLLATRLQTHRVLKLPRCPVCSQLNKRPAVTPLKISDP